MHVNQPTPLLRIVLWRILYISFVADAIFAYFLLCPGSTLAEKIITTDILNLSSPIIKMPDEYEDSMYLPEGKAESYSVISRPIILNIEDVSVTLRKTIYDGTWLYTSVSAIPLDSSTYLLPGDAQLSDSSKCFYKESTSKKEQSFLQVSKKDGKQLLVVYIYIKEFDEIGAYFRNRSIIPCPDRFL